MRLVNREFEQKVSEYLFRVVVVPFKPEIYGINPEPALSGSLQGSVMLQDKGMRVFQGYAQPICPFIIVLLMRWITGTDIVSRNSQ